MGSNKLELFINDNLYNDSVDIWLRESDTIQKYNIEFDGKYLVKTALKGEGELLNPFLKLPKHFAEALFKSISEHIADKGIKTKDQNLLEGKLQATEEHLKDMRNFSRKLLTTIITKSKSK
jgi:hypothetical protein